ncbi:MAG: hypothetical protein FJ146_15320 [Deltaproteobacteria bacterium]|nr:hypothetical protein [Deltaproteobacteria bacterium]
MRRSILHSGLVVTSLYSTLSGCGIADKITDTYKKNDDNQSAVQSKDPALVPIADDGKLIQLTDLDAPPDYKLKSLTWDEVIASLNGDSRLYTNQPTATPAPSDTPDPCDTAPNDARWVANKASAKFAESRDTSECQKAQQPTKSYTKFIWKTKNYQYDLCESGDLSGRNGKNQDAADADCPEISSRVEMLMEHSSDGLDDGARVEIDVKNIFFFGSNSLSGCKTSRSLPKITYSDDCMEVSKTMTAMKVSLRGENIGGGSEYEIKKTSFKGVASDYSSDKNVWHQSGVITIQKNNWQGTVTYKGSTTPPTYSFKNTDTNEMKTGTLTATPS